MLHVPSYLGGVDAQVKDIGYKTGLKMLK